MIWRKEPNETVREHGAVPASPSQGLSVVSCCYPLQNPSTRACYTGLHLKPSQPCRSQPAEGLALSLDAPGPVASTQNSGDSHWLLEKYLLCYNQYVKREEKALQFSLSSSRPPPLLFLSWASPRSNCFSAAARHIFAVASYAADYSGVRVRPRPRLRPGPVVLGG